MDKVAALESYQHAVVKSPQANITMSGTPRSNTFLGGGVTLSTLFGEKETEETRTIKAPELVKARKIDYGVWQIQDEDFFTQVEELDLEEHELFYCSGTHKIIIVKERYNRDPKQNSWHNMDIKLFRGSVWIFIEDDAMQIPQERKGGKIDFGGFLNE